MVELMTMVVASLAPLPRNSNLPLVAEEEQTWEFGRPQLLASSTSRPPSLLNLALRTGDNAEVVPGDGS